MCTHMFITESHYYGSSFSLSYSAIRTFTDGFGVVRKCGDEWLIKMTDSETHIPNIYEQVVGEVGFILYNVIMIF